MMDGKWASAAAAAGAVVILLLLVASFLYLLHKKLLPPGPIGLPIFGHFHLLGNSPHLDLYKLAQKHGSIMYMRFGFVPTIVVSSPSAAELVLKTHDLVFANRPHNEAANTSVTSREALFSADMVRTGVTCENSAPSSC
ncbi:hypothetical protein RD792_004989 [Penstemon davidsonii]|uniref:Uncharacterized protein n=1 Tax=Penstemon davidsonii TaxID=160366 RepID=A0ABR0DIY1_9LAMI|nr:hypothetical protein RD792_004989 [Penstemon davidsonii]